MAALLHSCLSSDAADLSVFKVDSTSTEAQKESFDSWFAVQGHGSLEEIA